jgi:hypothetical protein
MAERLRLLPQYRELDSTALYKQCKPVLNGWAKRIEAGGLPVSLGAISENALTSYSRPDNQSSLAEIGDRLIDSAAQIASLLCAERMTQYLKPMVLPKLENAANSGNPLPWGKTAKEITALANETEAGRKLQQLFGHLLSWHNPEEGSAYRKLLTEGANGTKPGIPKQLVPKLKELFLQGKKLLRSTGRK